MILFLILIFSIISVINTLSQINTSETSDQYAVSDQLFDLIHIADLIEQLIDKHYEEEIV